MLITANSAQRPRKSKQELDKEATKKKKSSKPVAKSKHSQSEPSSSKKSGTGH